MFFIPNLDNFEDIIVIFLHNQVYLAPILLLILEEAGLPFPIADFVIAYTGYQVSIGHIPYYLAFLILLTSDLFGASILFFLSRKYGNILISRFGKYIHLDPDKLTTVEKWFRKYGPFAIIIGRHIIGFRIPITVFSGISKMKYRTFLLSTFFSVALWIPFYLSVGMKLGPKTAHWLHLNHWLYLVVFIPFIVSIVPFYFMRKKS